MGTLGDSFGAALTGLKQQMVDSNLTPGAVIYMVCPFTTPVKSKYLVVGCCEPQLLVLVINSEINDFISNNPELLACQVDVPKQDHDFLKHDSIVNCIQTHEAFNLSAVRGAIMADYSGVYRGRLKDYCIREVIDAVNRSVVMEARHCKWITAGLSSVV
ncbi:hypothetical protein [Serratia fonticola]|uniref:hypothetical protein n=1 Tax=Serratia fonticola TaxID=47917 RepID=UPI001FD737FB|nr:hypothetical protein [Serratia fonticola]CAI1135229.1 Uncharacterised protein [Serratia fonticola]